MGYSTMLMSVLVHKSMIIVAHVPTDPGAEVTYVCPIETRHCDMHKLIRRNAEELIFDYKAGPRGYHLYHVKFYEGLGMMPSRAYHTG